MPRLAFQHSRPYLIQKAYWFRLNVDDHLVWFGVYACVCVLFSLAGCRYGRKQIWWLLKGLLRPAAIRGSVGLFALRPQGHSQDGAWVRVIRGPDVATDREGSVEYGIRPGERGRTAICWRCWFDLASRLCIASPPNPTTPLLCTYCILYVLAFKQTTTQYLALCVSMLF